MKMLWKSAAMSVLVGSAALAGCATPPAAPKSPGLTVEQLTNIAEPRPASWWLPKFSMPRFNDPARNRQSNSSAMDVEHSSPSRSGKSESKGDPFAMARLYEKRGQTEAAVKLFEQELARNPSNGVVHHRLAVIASKDGNWAKARRHFDAALEQMPENSELLCDLGYALYLQHQLPDAEAALTAALQANPRNTAAHNNLGIVLGVQGRLDECLAEFRRAGGEAEAYANLAYVHTQLGDVEQAMTNLHRALSHDPNLRQAAVALVQLNELKVRLKPAQDAPPHSDAMLAKSVPANAAAPPAAVAAGERTLPTQPSSSVPGPAQVAASQAPTSSLVEFPRRPVEKLASTAIKPSMRHELPGPAEPASKPPVEVRPAPVVSPAQAIASSKAVARGDHRASKSPADSPTTRQRLMMPVVMRPVGANQGEQALHTSRVSTFAPIVQREMAEPRLETGDSQPPRMLGNAAVHPLHAPPLLARLDSASSGPAPVISPSQAMQALREQEHLVVLSENKSLENPYLKPRGADKTVRQAAPDVSAVTMDAMEATVAPALFATGDTVAAMNGVVMSEFAEALKPDAAVPVSGTTSDKPLFAPQNQLPGPMDQFPTEARILQLPTSQLHPNAQPTWSAQSRPVAGTDPQPTTKNAHFFDWTGKTNP